MTSEQTPQRQVSFKSQLSLTLLLVGLLPAVIIATVVLVSAQSALRTAAEERVTTAAEGRASALEAFTDTVKGQITTFSQDRAVIDALVALPAAFEAMGEEAGVDDTSFKDIEASVSDYYRGPFKSAYQEANGAETGPSGADVGGLDRPAVVAQYAYIAGNRHPLGSKDELNDAGNATAYDRVHASIHPGVRAYLDEFGYYDIFLIDAESGRIVYSVYKEVDYGTSLSSGPWAGTNLGRVYREALTLGSSDKYAMVGYEKYGPSYDAPASFVASPVFNGRDLVGVVAFQLPLDRVSAAVSSVTGLGETGDAFLVGPDNLLRSDSLRSEEHTTVASFRGGITVDNEAVSLALAGGEGILEGPSLHDTDALVAYRPVPFGDGTLALLTSQDVSEALGPARTAMWWSIGLLVLMAGAIAAVALKATGGMAKNVADMVKTIVGQSGDVASGKLLARNEPSRTRYREFTPVLESINQVADAFTAQMDAVPVPIVVHDKDMRVCFSNAEAARVACKDKDELLGQVFYEHAEPSNWREPNFGTRQTLSTGAASTSLSRWTTPVGERDIRSAQTPIEVEGEVVGVLETLLDETEIRGSERTQTKIAEYNNTAVGLLTTAFEKVIAGDLCVSFEPPQTDDPEVDEAAKNFALIASAFERTMSEFRATIDTTRENAGRTAHAAEELSQLAATLINGNETTADRAATVAAATEEMSANVDSVASAAEEMSINIGSVSENASAMSTRMRDVASAIERLSGSISDVAEAAANGSSVASDAAQKSSQANQAMDTLGRAATEIDKVTEVIKRIAEKTNLLALNATIEAASAGEAGKGFAVVAHEVKELANQCSTAAEDITERIAGVQRNTEEAVQVISAMSEIIADLASVSDGIAMRASEQDHAVAEISATVASVDTGVERTASAIAEIVQGANDVSRNAGELTAGSTEVASSIGEVNVLAQSGGSAAERVGDAAAGLTSVVDELRDGVQRFNTTAGSKKSGLKVA